VPYQGRNGTDRRPIYIECRENLIVLQPEGVELTPRDFVGQFGPGNPLAAAVRAKSEYLARQAPPGAARTEPYPLMLVRPEGVAAYYAARAALDSWGSDFGYELIGSDWRLKFPEPDPQLARLTREVVADARTRHREYALSVPSSTKRRARPEYRARHHGGFAASGGQGGGGHGAGFNDFAGDWATGGVASGNATDPYADPPGATGDFAPGGNSAQANRIGGKPTAGGTAGPSGWPSAGTHGGSRSESDMAARPPGGSPYDSTPPYDSAGSPQGAQDRSSMPPGSDSSFAEGHPRAGEPGSATAEATAADPAPGSSSASTAQQPYAGTGQLGASQNPIHVGSPAAPHLPVGKQTKSIAATRGSGWGLPESSVGSVGATRPILVECYPDRLVVQSDARGVPPKEIRLGTQTEAAMDELVATVWDQINAWGKAGKGLYWKPTLSINVRPGAATRFAEIRALLADSGLDVKERQPPAAARPQTTRSRTTEVR
jgi:hypothetical protein